MIFRQILHHSVCQQSSICRPRSSFWGQIDWAQVPHCHLLTSLASFFFFFNFFKPRSSQLQKENNTNNIMIYWSRSLGSNGITSEGFVQSKTTIVNYVDFTYIFLLNPHHNSRHNINKYYYYRWERWGPERSTVSYSY